MCQQIDLLGCKIFSSGGLTNWSCFSHASRTMCWKTPSPIPALCQATIGFTLVSSSFKVIALEAQGLVHLSGYMRKMRPCQAPDLTRTRNCLVGGGIGQGPVLPLWCSFIRRCPFTEFPTAPCILTQSLSKWQHCMRLEPAIRSKILKCTWAAFYKIFLN